MAYSPDNRSNAYKGIMSLPGVGATVVISFLNGQRGTPIILGVVPGVADVASIHGVGLRDEVFPNYPWVFSNLAEATGLRATGGTPSEDVSTKVERG